MIKRTLQFVFISFQNTERLKTFHFTMSSTMAEQCKPAREVTSWTENLIAQLRFIYFSFVRQLVNFLLHFCPARPSTACQVSLEVSVGAVSSDPLRA